jgi:serine protease Do
LLALVAIAASGFTIWRASRRAPAVAAAPPPAVASSAPAAEPAGGPPAAAAPPTQAEIARRATAASAVVSCDAGIGTAFFVAPERAITNAHVLCGDALVKVALSDGRELVGKPAFSDERTDVAVLDVVGAAATPLAVGDSTTLAPGDAVTLVGNPSGLTFTVHEGRVSYVGRNILGVGFVQVDAAVNPGNSGGPLLDARGEVVGIVSMKVSGADGLGLALPIEYARAPAGLPAPSAQADARWRAFVARVAAEDAGEASRFAARLEVPVIFAVQGGARGGLRLLVGRRFGGAPWDLPIDVDVRAGERVLCGGAGRVTGWQPLEKALGERLSRAASAPQARWALRHGVAKDVFVGAADVELGGCRAVEIPDKAVIAIRGGARLDGPVAFPRDAFAASVSMGTFMDRQAEARERQERSQSEAKWRRAFAEARARIARLEARRSQLEAYLAQTPSDYRARDELAKTAAELPQARTAYEDLERKASHEAVPREWRQ